MAASRERDQKAMNLLLERGIISKEATLRDLAQISSDLSGMAGDLDEVASWTFVGPNYVYKGDKIADMAPEALAR